MSVTNTPNMALPVPGVGTESGPQYATDVNNCLEIVDRHDHTPGSGVLITPSAININTDLTFAGNFATNVAGVTFAPQSTTPPVDTVYVDDVDLYFRDGDGNVIQLTTNGGVVGTPGSITNLTPPASATYVSVNSTFVWQSGVNIAANMDAGSLLLRNLTPNSTYALTLSPPVALGFDYTLTLPTLPLATAFLTIDTSGAIDGSVPTSLGITSSMLAADSVTTSKIVDLNVTEAKLAANSVSTSKIIDANVTKAKLAADAFYSVITLDLTGSTTVVVPAGVTGIDVTIVGGGGGGGASAAAASVGAGGGGNGGSIVVASVAVTPGETLTFTRGAGGVGGVGAGVGGTSGGSSTLTGSFGVIQAVGGLGGNPGSGGTGGAAQSALRAGFLQAPGGSGGSGVSGNTGEQSPRGDGGTAGSSGSGFGGGGGGGAGLSAGGAGGNAGSSGSTAAVANAGGGGGGGGADATAARSGGDGRNGRCIIQYIGSV